MAFKFGVDWKNAYNSIFALFSSARNDFLWSSLRESVPPSGYKRRNEEIFMAHQQGIELT